MLGRPVPSPADACQRGQARRQEQKAGRFWHRSEAEGGAILGKGKAEGGIISAGRRGDKYLGEFDLEVLDLILRGRLTGGPARNGRAGRAEHLESPIERGNRCASRTHQRGAPLSIAESVRGRGQVIHEIVLYRR